MVYQRLCLRLVQFGSEILDRRFHLRFDVLELDCTQLFEFGEIITGDVHVVEQHQRLDELLHTVQSIGIGSVDGIAQVKNDFERSQSGLVQGVFHDRYIAQIMCALIDDAVEIGDLKVPVLGVTGVMYDSFGVGDISHTQNGSIAESVVIHNEGRTGIGDVDLKR